MSPVVEVRNRWSENDYFWPAMLVRSLEEKARGLSVLWAEQCIRRLLHLMPTVNRAALLQDLDALAKYRAAPLSYNEIITKSREIWYRESPGRDEAQTAVSKLFGAFAEAYCSDKPPHLNALFAPINILIWEAPRKDEYFEIVLEEYVKIESAAAVSQVQSGGTG